jgi:plastocyanin domain-containing protein
MEDMMKKLLSMMTCAAVLAVVACGGGEARQQSATATAPAATASAPAPAAPAAPKEFAVKISGAEIIPASLTIPKGEPVRLTFTRDEQPTCGDEIVFASLNIRKKIPVNQPTAIDLPAQANAGELTFACGMDMMKGTIVVQ